MAQGRRDPHLKVIKKVEDEQEKAISPNPKVDKRCKCKKRTMKVIGNIAVVALKVTGEIDDEEDNDL